MLPFGNKLVFNRSLVTITKLWQKRTKKGGKNKINICVYRQKLWFPIFNFSCLPVTHLNIGRLQHQEYPQSKCNKLEIIAFYLPLSPHRDPRKPMQKSWSVKEIFILFKHFITCINDRSRVCFDIIFSSSSKNRSNFRIFIWSKMAVARLVCMSMRRFFSKRAGSELTADVSFCNEKPTKISNKYRRNQKDEKNSGKDIK